MRRRAFVFGLASCLPAMAWAAESRPIEVEDAWGRINRDGTITVYFDIISRRDEADALTMATSGAADQVILHQMKWQGSNFRVERIRRIAVPPRSRTRLKPGAIYLTLVGPEKGLTPGSTVPLTLSFEKTAAVEVKVRLTNQMLGNLGREG